MARWYIIHAYSGYLSSRDAVVHFGLGSAPAADEIVVTWPRGETERFPPLTRNQMVVLLKGQGTAVEVAN